MAGFVLGLNAKLGYDVLGAANDTWLELTNVRDLSVGLSSAVADVSTRNSGGFRQQVATLSDGNLEWGMVYDNSNAGFVVIKDAYFAKSVIGLFAADGGLTTVGTEGLKGDFMITDFSIDENLEEAMMVNITASLTYSAFVPLWDTVSV